MDTIGDDFRKNAIIGEYLTNDSRLPVRECAHGIEGMNRITNAALDRRFRFFKGCIGMSHC